MAESGHGESQVFLGSMIARGLGTQADIEHSAMWFKRAASLGSAPGAFFYGRLLSSKYKHKEALKWYYIASDRGYVPRIFRVGYSLVRGKGTVIDIPSGYKYLFSAAKSGHFLAIKEIGILDFKGERGFYWRLLGLGFILYAVCYGIIFTFIDPNSDRLLN